MNRPRHLLHVFPTFSAAGAQVRTATLMRAFGERYRHSLVALDGVTEAAHLAEGVALEVIPWHPPAGPMAGVRGSRSLLERLNPDLLLTYNWGAMDTVVAARSARFTRHVHHEDGFTADEADKLKGRRNWTRRVSLHGTDVVVPSASLERIAREVWHLPRVHLIPNGVDPDRFARDPEAGPRFRAEHGIPADAFVVGTVGQLRPVKRFDRFIAAMASAPWPDGVRPWAVLVGDGEERARLEAQAAGLEGVGITFTGRLRDVVPAYSAFDVFSLTSATEQQPMALLEAMAAGLPVVATDVGDIATTLPAEARPFVVPHGHGDPRPHLARHLGEAYARLAANPGLRSTLGRASRARVEEAYALSTLTARYAEIYDRAAGR